MTEKPKTDRAASLSALFRRIGKLERHLLENVYGQEKAVESFVKGYFDAEAMANAEKNRTAPRAVFMFTGPKGVGKSYLAEEAAHALSIPYKRFNMSGLGDDLQYRSLVGSSNRHYPTEGTLTSFVRANPKSVVLFDGVERMHLETLEMAHEILRTGFLRDDYLAEAVSFRNTYVIFTTSDAYSHNAETIDAHAVAFYDLGAGDLERIVCDELAHCAALFEKQYGIRAEIDGRLPAALLASLPKFSGTKRLRKAVHTFFKNELYALRGLFSEAEADDAVAGSGGAAMTLEQIETVGFALADGGGGHAQGEAEREITASGAGAGAGAAITVTLSSPKLVDA